MALSGGAEFHHKTDIDFQCILLLLYGSLCTTDDNLNNITAEKWESIQEKALGWKKPDRFEKVRETVDWEKGPKGHHMHSAYYTVYIVIQQEHAVSNQAEKRKRKIEDDIEKVNLQNLIGPLPEATCTSPKTLCSSFGVLHDKTICVWCRKKIIRQVIVTMGF